MRRWKFSLRVSLHRLLNTSASRDPWVQVVLSEEVGVSATEGVGLHRPARALAPCAASHAHHLFQLELNGVMIKNSPGMVLWLLVLWHLPTSTGDMAFKQ